MGATASGLLPPGQAVGFGERHCLERPRATALQDTRIWLLLGAFRDSARAWSPASERTDAPVIQHTAGIWRLHQAGTPSPEEVVSSLQWSMVIVLSTDHVATTVALLYSLPPFLHPIVDKRLGRHLWQLFCPLAWYFTSHCGVFGFSRFIVFVRIQHNRKLSWSLVLFIL